MPVRIYIFSYYFYRSLIIKWVFALTAEVQVLIVQRMFMYVTIVKVMVLLLKQRDWDLVSCNNSREHVMFAMEMERNFIQPAMSARVKGK
jgi:hypothetical protein